MKNVKKDDKRYIDKFREMNMGKIRNMFTKDATIDSIKF